MTAGATTVFSSSTVPTSSETTVAVVPTTDSSPTAAFTSTTGAGTTTSSESAATSTSSKSTKPFPTASVIGGVVGGLGGLLLIGAMVWAGSYRLRRKGQPSSGMPGGRSYYKRSRTVSSFGNIIKNPLSISSPMLQEDTAFRSDFIRKQSTSPVSHFSTVASDGGQRTMNPGFSGAGSYRTVSPPRSRGTASLDAIVVPPIRNMRGSLSRHQQEQWKQSLPGMEEINVGADPSIVAHAGFQESTIFPSALQTPPPVATVTGNSGSQRQQSGIRQTTFSDMMAAASLDLGHYVPDSVQSTPDLRRK
ncbi:hypothetical protein CMQ_1667 [Grosmannia clavigera kw1407]|uniref:Uncharacterized protein n=1 Tax=Grosmannia clavigera (strain kw1407 / UAMH 11150) TaxID=655863 RepID=F0XD88_GROCL|nr:uncharacterized protein CMQ_1667 [Grosmannia clavigera kw1407]EFX04739.1 hypothetical protein CMQ_1667 [Grosmannia clavigera kw1407]